MNSYGLFGYAVYSHVSADYIEFFPPNTPPEITGSDPTNGQTDVPVSLSELRFRIADADADLMNYSVTTSPDIGSGSAGLKPDGVFTVPVSHLMGSTTYTWHVDVSDGKDTTSKDFTFTTQMLAPVISNPIPPDHAVYVPTTLTNLTFTIVDPQGDLINWTLQTAPDIGSGSGTHTANGTYCVPIANLQYFTNYTWTVNATDGQHWNRRTYTFRTAGEHEIGFLPTDDDTILENHPDDHCYDCQWLNTRSESGWEADTLIKFDISSLPPNITINSASLQLYYYYNWDGDPTDHWITAHRITNDWNEFTVNWTNRPSYNPQPTCGATVPPTTNVWMSWDVTADIQHYYNGTFANYGWRLYDTSGDNKITYVRSKEYSDYRPLLIIEYNTSN